MTTVLQKAVTPAQVRAYLTQGFDRIAGYVVRAAEVSAVTAVSDLRRLHHVDYPGSPFPVDGPLHILHVDRSPSWQLASATTIKEQAIMETSGTVEVQESLVETFFLDHTRLTSGARLWRFEDDHDPVLVASFLGPELGWQLHEEDDSPMKLMAPVPIVGSIVTLGGQQFPADVVSDEAGNPVDIVAVSAVEPAGDLGFTKTDNGMWVRDLDFSQAEALFEMSVVGTWNGEPVKLVHAMRTTENLAVYRVFSLTRDWEKSRDARFTEIELGVWEATVPQAEVTGISTRETSAGPWMTPQQKAKVAAAQAAQAAQGPQATTSQAGPAASTAPEAQQSASADNAGAGSPAGPDTTAPSAAAANPDVPVFGGPPTQQRPASTPTAEPGTGDAAHLALYERISRAVLPFLPTGTAQVRVMAQSVGNVIELSAQAQLADGTTSNLPQIGQDAAAAFGELRAISYGSTEGPWFGALATITPNGQFTITFNKENQPRMQREITAEMLAAERERFPRETWPQWFLDREAETE